ncbi:MAG: hypothetical protein U1A27_11855 [Phycisphaerae bacterium]
MVPDIKPGSMVKLEVTRRPTSEAAAKTLSRLFKKDPVNQRADRLRTKLRTRQMQGRRRGGRIWWVRPFAPRLIQPQAGASCQIRATIDVLRDLGSVTRFVRVTSAK